MKLKSFLIFLTVFVFFPVISKGGPREDGISYYNQGKYQEALLAFESVDTQNPSDFYNKGNCHFKLGHTGLALAYFEKAHSLWPSNSDISKNRSIAEKKLKESGIYSEDSSFWRGTLVPWGRACPETLLWILVASALFAMAKTFSKKDIGRTASALIFMFSLGAILISTILLQASRTPIAIISVESAPARSGPGLSFSELFRLTAGTKVSLLEDSREGWTQVRFSIDNIGWISEKDLLKLQ